MAEWVYVLSGFGLSAGAVLAYALRLQLRIGRLRRDRRREP